MLRGFLGILLLLIALGLTGCASSDDNIHDRETSFSGVRHDFCAVGSGGGFGETVCPALDLPWSAVVDTLEWPFDIIHQRYVHRGNESGSSLDESNRIKYCYVSYNPTNWPNSILISGWSGPADKRNGIIKNSTIFVHGARMPTSQDGYAWLALPGSLSRIQLGPGDVVSNNLSIADAPTAQLIERIVKMREQLEREKTHQ
jgi:uncharacterized protein YceK